MWFKKPVSNRVKALGVLALFSAISLIALVRSMTPKSRFSMQNDALKIEHVLDKLSFEKARALDIPLEEITNAPDLIEIKKLIKQLHEFYSDLNVPIKQVEFKLEQIEQKLKEHISQLDKESRKAIELELKFIGHYKKEFFENRK